MMNIRRTKLALWILAAALSSGGAAIVMLSLWWPYHQPAPYAVDKPTTRSIKADIPPQPTLQDFTGVWDRNLRPPLVDPPVESAPEEIIETKTAIVHRPNLRLIGYTVEADQSLAILMGQEGTAEFVAIGEELDGVTVLSISTSGVLLDHQGDEYTLSLEEEPRDPPGTRQDARRVDRSGYEVGRYR